LIYGMHFGWSQLYVTIFIAKICAVTELLK
jgi:hypothetical protein